MEYEDDTETINPAVIGNQQIQAEAARSVAAQAIIPDQTQISELIDKIILKGLPPGVKKIGGVDTSPARTYAFMNFQESFVDKIHAKNKVRLIRMNTPRRLKTFAFEMDCRDLERLINLEGTKGREGNERKMQVTSIVGIANSEKSGPRKTPTLYQQAKGFFGMNRG
jgi:hypothetical protein